MASPSHVEATEGFFHRLGIAETLPEAAQDKDYYSGLIRDQLKLDASQPGRVSVTFTVKSAFTNPYNTLHGGVVAAVAEIVGMACAKTVIKDKEFFLGEFSTSYLAAARLNQEVEVVGNILRRGRSVVVIAVDFKDSATMAAQICGQVLSVFSAPPTSFTPPLDVLVAEISSAASASGKIFVYGVGREGLMMRALCMRLYHLGLPAHVVGDMTAPPISAGDLLLASAGPGGFSTVDAICGVARSAGARVVLLTARPDSGSGARKSAHAVAYVPAQTMADEEAAPEPGAVRLPMGSLYEGALFVLFEMVVMRLTEVLKQSPAQLRSRHTNLE